MGVLKMGRGEYWELGGGGGGEIIVVFHIAEKVLFRLE